MQGQTVVYWVSTVLPLTLLIKPPLIHINIPASAEINPLNHLSQQGDQRCYVGGEKQADKNTGYDTALELTWPHHHIWNATNFPFPQSEDLVQAMAWEKTNDNKNKSTFAKLKITLDNQTKWGDFVWAEMAEVYSQHALPWARNTRSSASWEKGIPVDFNSSTKASLRVGGCTALLVRMGWKKQNKSLWFW